MAVELGSHQCRGALESGVGSHTAAHLGLRLRLCKREGIHAFGLHQAGSSAALQHSQYMGTRIMRSTRPGHEGIAGLDLAAVGTQHGRVLAQPLRRLLRRRQQGQEVLVCHSDSCGASVITPGCTDMSGCTPRMRSVCCTTSLNTGAATMPP